MDRNAASLQYLIEQAEAVAQQQKAKRTRLNAQALAQHGKRLDPQRITAALDAVYQSEPSRLHPAWQRLQTAVLRP